MEADGWAHLASNRRGQQPIPCEAEGGRKRSKPAELVWGEAALDMLRHTEPRSCA